MHEDVRSPLTAGQEPETTQAVEPLDLSSLEPAGRGDRHMGSWRRHLRRMYRGTLVHRDHAEGLQAFWTLQHLADDPRAFIGRLEAVTSQARHVKEDVRHPVVGHDETKTLGHIEPLDDAGQLDEIGRRFVDEFSDRPWSEIGPRHF